MPAKPLDASQISHILEIERTRFTEVKDDLLEPQKVQIDACLGLWLIPDKSSRQWGRKRARQFLEAIYNDKSLGKDVFLLCAIGIVVTRLGRINLVEAVSVIRKWWRSVDHPHGLTETAEEYVQERQDAFSKIKRVPESSSAPLVPADDRMQSIGSQFTHTTLDPNAAVIPLHAKSTDQEERHRAHDGHNISQEACNHISCNTYSHVTQEVFEHASLLGTGTIFNKYLCDVIRKVCIRVGTSSVWKAAVTTVFPIWGGPVDCLLSLDICEWGVEYLMKTLFNAKVRSTEQGRHIVLREGTTLIVPKSETILKGVNESAIIEVFGSEIHKGIIEGPVRKREFQEGKEMTECVSMILTRQGAIINLSLGLERGLEIKGKLYS